MKFKSWKVEDDDSPNSPRGTVLTAGSLHGPTLLPAPSARTRTHVLDPVVRLGTVADDLLALIFGAQLVPVVRSGLVSSS